MLDIGFQELVLIGVIYLGTRLRGVEERLETWQAPLGDPAVQLEEAGPRHLVYVPAYSHIYAGAGTPAPSSSAPTAGWSESIAIRRHWPRPRKPRGIVPTAWCRCVAALAT